jgi:hypothetical protein
MPNGTHEQSLESQLAALRERMTQVENALKAVERWIWVLSAITGAVIGYGALVGYVLHLGGWWQWLTE